MPRHRKQSNASSTSSIPDRNQELESMYDYLAKVILIGPSGTGKSCLLHRFVKDEWRVLSSQTIGVEFSSKIVKIGTGSRRKRIKLQLWDTAGTERFRSVSRSYYRGAAGAVLVYDVSSYASFAALPTFLMDARALASPNLTTILAGNKTDLLVDGDETEMEETEDEASTSIANSVSSSRNTSMYMFDAASSKTGAGSLRSVTSTNFSTAGTRLTATKASHGRQVSDLEAIEWATRSNIPVAVEVSAFSGQNVEELFTRLARIILTKIELGEIDPDDPQSGIQYGDSGAWGMAASDAASVRSGLTVDDSASQLHGRRKRNAKRSNNSSWMGSAGEWGDVFRITGSTRGGCC
ncbi:Ras family GTPase (Rab4b), putative [Talaromyces stipitatus ATCC 10500]|uniref:Ras family GTPase (Rab4b), putative n=1 Tax=Talaromyces stipitatus (strain ATCC 10500 / CBS 375.48 / QM 6759 / NRRL 1006) TaxID=441959 RepID=B8MTW7_TALSN|nr:Ras family GTPase (Rab4b), putative [Talaromyces stipitatus ATCC 10500]EED12581.1 Ras family GTPase (Rab4b), putative [Talaromyces stipitatus ATCC 10500]